MNTSAFLLRLTLAVLAIWSPLAVAEMPPTLGVQLNNGLIGLSVTGHVGQVYHIETTTNFTGPIRWIPIDYLTLPISPYLYTDTRAPTAARRFYRARESNVLPITNMVFIPPGTFMMGSPASEAEHGSDETQHPVALTRGFWMGKYEVTQGEYGELMGINPSYFRNGKTSYGGGNGGTVTNELRHPVEKVSWDDATNYCGELTQRQFGAGHIPVGWRYRLPTESEWEYACRAGTTTPFHFGETISTEQANYDGNGIYGTGKKGVFRNKTTPVDRFPANAWGLHDMHGNLFQWCQDWYGDYPTDDQVDPQGGKEGLSSVRVLRGGSWGGIPKYCRSAFRRPFGPGFGGPIFGLRLCFFAVCSGLLTAAQCA